MKKFWNFVFGIILTGSVLFAQGTVTIHPKLGPMKPSSNADDPAIWIHPNDPSKSLFFLSDKSAGVFVYNVQGQQLQHINFGTALNNIDVRYDFQLGSDNIDILAGNLRDVGKLAVLKINGNSTSPLSILASRTSTGNDISDDSYGFALYRRPSDGAMFVFEKPASSAPIKQYLIDDSSGQVVVTPVRTINDVAMGQSEGFVADDKLGFVYFAEEGKGIHKYNADPNSSNLNRLSFFASGDGTVSDREGLCLYACDNGDGYLILSSQGNSTFKVYERGGSNRFIKTFVAAEATGTDGLDVSTAAIPGFPNGFLIIHDDPQMQYYVYDWADVAQTNMTICVNGGGGPPPPPPQEQVATPEIDPDGGEFEDEVEVSLSTTTSDATIRYTLNGSNPASSSTLYNGPFTLTSSATVKARAFKSGMTDSEVASAIFDITNPPPPQEQVATPEIDPDGGEFEDEVEVSLSTTTSDATIRYTLNGGNPTSSSTLYDAPFTLTSNATVKARAFKAGMTDSEVASADFTITGPPSEGDAPMITRFNPASGPPGIEVTINGLNFENASSVKFNGIEAGLFEVLNARRIVAEVPLGVGPGKISVTTPAGTAVSAENFFVVVTPRPSDGMVFYPTDDAYVRSSNPNTSYGSASTLRARASRKKTLASFLKFVVDGVDGEIEQAFLRLYTTQRVRTGSAVYAVSNDYRNESSPWQQDDLTWNNAPEVHGDELSSVGEVPSKSWAEFEVTAALDGDGIYSFVVINDENNVAFFSSQEGPNRPELLIIMKDGDGTAARVEAAEDATEVGVAQEAIPEKFSLSPAYPNPFNGVAVIKYDLPQPGSVRLTIYNSLGQQVRKLIDEEQTAGYKRTQWDATDDHGQRVSSGVYLFHLDYGKQRYSGRVILQQ